MSLDERKDLLKIICNRNYLANPKLLKLIESDIAHLLPDPFTQQQKLAVDFQQRIIDDYKELRDSYVNARRWFLPKINAGSRGERAKQMANHNVIQNASKNRIGH